VNPDVILTAAEMRAAEERVIAAGTPVETLMERAGMGAAEAIWRFAGPMPALILCGPGNNGGDGYVIARGLRARGAEVRVAALGEPATAAARWARSSWDGPVGSLGEAEPAPLLVDALFGTGLTRPLESNAAAASGRLAAEAQVRVAIDLPSGVSTDDGQLLSPVPNFDLTVTFGALKPSHLLQPSCRHMGRIVVADIGIEANSELHRLTGGRRRAPSPDDHKYSRGYVAVLAGEMPGAAALAAEAAARAGAGYVRLVAPMPIAGLPAAIVQGGASVEAVLDDGRVGAVLIGPGLGRGDKARALLHQTLESQRSLVLDADALGLVAELGLDVLERASVTPILTPHAGEFARLFYTHGQGKVDDCRRAARKAAAVIVSKGPDTVVASPDGRAAIARPAPGWLATAGTGDVLAGIIAAELASLVWSFEAACAGVWMHGEAARKAGPAFIADDLLAQLRPVIAEQL
jgi:hydroxyethylthiazole kinase-like uncharacterized protein yjeF